jgi:hypothetical protein
LVCKIWVKTAPKPPNLRQDKSMLLDVISGVALSIQTHLRTAKFSAIS